MSRSPYNKRNTIILTAVITFVLTMLLFYGGCRVIGRFIISKKGCESFNIDNYELRTSTNISNTKDATCQYDTATHTKSSIFYLELSTKELIDNIEWNDFRKVTERTSPHFRYNDSWNTEISKVPASYLYSKTGSYKADSWTYVLDSARQILWAELTEDINYKE